MMPWDRRYHRLALPGLKVGFKILAAGLLATVHLSAVSWAQESRAEGNPIESAVRGEAERYYPKRDWSTFNRGSLNHSIYIYRDRNRNGVYDVGDLPLGNVAVVMTGPGGGRAVRRSNIQGFTNFKMSVTDRKQPIDHPGEYEFRAIAPPGWVVTSGNARQTNRFDILTGAIADMVATTLPDPIGLAPELRVTGRVVKRSDDGGLSPVGQAELSAIGPEEGRQRVEVDEDGSFSFLASEGQWRIVAVLDGERSERTVRVGETPVRMSAMVLGEELGSPAPNEVLLDFEDITQSNLAKIPSGTGGITWHYLNVTEMLTYSGEGYINSVMSGHYVAYNSSGHPVTLSDDRGFDFVGAYLGLAWIDAEGEELIVEAWRGDRLVGREVFSLSSLGPFWFDAEYRNITRLTLTTRHYWQFVTDDLVIRTRGSD